MLDFLLPDCTGLKLTRLILLPQQLLLLLHSTNPFATCPYCQTVSTHVHSYYSRTLTDLAWSDLTVSLRIQVRRFRCANAACSHLTFAERLGPAITAYARRTARCQQRLLEVALALGGEAGAVLARAFGLTVSPDTLLRITRKTALPDRATPRVLGVDDFAFRRGATYGTILLDLEQGYIVELLPERSSESLIKWLNNHPGVEIVSRDRGGIYAEAVRTAAPDAIQVADRFHLHQNLNDTLERIMRRFYPVIEKALSPTTDTALPNATLTPDQPVTTDVSLATPTINQPVALATIDTTPLPLSRWEREKELNQQKRMLLYQQIVDLYNQGCNQVEIAAQLGTSTRRIRQYLKGPPVPPIHKPRASKLDPYKAYLKRRFYEEGCVNGLALLREITAQGYTGSSTIVTNYISQLRHAGGASYLTGKTRTQPKPLKEKLPSPQELKWWFVLGRERLKTKQLEVVEKLKAFSGELAQVYELAQGFVGLLHSGSDKGLNGWLEQVESSQVAELVSLSKGIRRDEAAVRAGLNLKWSQGVVEGTINRLKLVKRQGYGRANFDLLRIRMLATS